MIRTVCARYLGKLFVFIHISFQYETIINVESVKKNLFICTYIYIYIDHAGDRKHEEQKVKAMGNDVSGTGSFFSVVDNAMFYCA